MFPRQYKASARSVRGGALVGTTRTSAVTSRKMRQGFRPASALKWQRVSPGFVFADSAPRQELDAGFEFIETHSPIATGGLEQLRWSTKQLAEKTSPIRGWPVGLVEKALRAITTEGVLVKKEHAWFITLTPQHYEPWFISMLEYERASEAR